MTAPTQLHAPHPGQLDAPVKRDSFIRELVRFVNDLALGSGGTVTQLTSKSTAVEINKRRGQIVTHSASLAIATAVSFTVTNSTVEEDDIPIVARRGGASGGSYLVNVTDVNDGSFRITIRNLSTLGPLAEALTLNFAVLKGAVV